MNIWKVILATMVIFGTGVVTGGLMVKQSMRGRPWSVHRPVAETNRLAQPPRYEQFRRMEFVFRAHRELQLSPKQREDLERIIREGQEQVRQVWDQVTPKLRAELQSVQEQIRKELTPEQRERFEELMKRYRTPRPEEGSPSPDRSRDRMRPPQEGSTPEGPPPAPRRDRRLPPESPPIP